MRRSRQREAGERESPTEPKVKSSRRTRRNRPVLVRPSLATVTQLEQRLLRSADTYSYDGTGNNLLNPTWASNNAPLLRLAGYAYADGISTPAGASRPSARELSNKLMVQRGDDIFSARALSDFGYAWGQFIDHDMDLTQSATTPSEPFNIQVPSGDVYFDPDNTGTMEIPMGRAEFIAGTGVTTPRTQFNEISGFLDGSVVYGSDPVRAAALRTFSGGRLNTSDGDLMPFNTAGFANDTGGGPANSYFLGGDRRANENAEFTVVNTLMVREHNRLAGVLAGMHPTWDDEQLYQEARKLNVAEIQIVTYNEFLPALMGDNAMPAYTGYDPTVNPGISAEFSTAAFRFGHSMLGNDVQFFDDQGNETADALKMADILFNPQVLVDNGIDSLLKYLNTNNAEENDLANVDSIRNLLFGLPGQGGLDLLSIDIQRGRDLGLADFNTTRQALGLPAMNFSDFTYGPNLGAALQTLYGSPDNIDLFVGGLAEVHLPGSSLGPTFQAILIDQFTRTRAGDRLWYQNNLSPDELAMVQGTTLTRLLKDNTTLDNIQDNSFFYDAQITGTVFADKNADGIQQPNEPALADRFVYLFDDDEDAVLDVTTTDANGYYSFSDIQVGNYRTEANVGDHETVTTQPMAAVNFSRGQIYAGNNFGIFQNAPVATTTDPAPVGETESDSPVNPGPPATPTRTTPGLPNAFPNAFPVKTATSILHTPNASAPTRLEPDTRPVSAAPGNTRPLVGPIPPASVSRPAATVALFAFPTKSLFASTTPVLDKPD